MHKFPLEYSFYKILPKNRITDVSHKGIRLVWAKDFNEACKKGFPDFTFDIGTNCSKTGRNVDADGVGEGVTIYWNGFYSENNN